MRRAARTLSALLALGTASAPLGAQQPRQLLDRIVAIVGERAVFLSEIEEEILLQRSQGLQPPEDSAGRTALRRQVLERLIDEELLYQRARRDTAIIVTDAEVQNAVDEQVRRVRAQFSSESEYQSQLAAAGFGTSEEYRRWYAEQQRRSEFQRRYLEKLRQEGRLRSGAVPEEEMRRAYAEARGQPGGIRRRPPTASFRQIVIAPRPTEAARVEARARAESVLAEIRRGADFAAAARRLSHDPSTREQGGELNWFRRGMMVRPFEEAAFRLRPGQVSNLVETPFGYHLILVERVQLAEVKARHILFAPAVTASELAAARGLADSAAALLRAGASFDSLADAFSDSTEPRQVGPVDRAQLPPEFVPAFEGASAGQIAGPIVLYPETPARTRFVVAELTEVQPERDFTYEEVRDQIRQGLQQERAIRDLLATMRSQTYIDVRLE